MTRSAWYNDTKSMFVVISTVYIESPPPCLPATYLWPVCDMWTGVMPCKCVIRYGLLGLMCGNYTRHESRCTRKSTFTDRYIYWPASPLTDTCSWVILRLPHSEHTLKRASHFWIDWTSITSFKKSVMIYKDLKLPLLKTFLCANK